MKIKIYFLIMLACILCTGIVNAQRIQILDFSKQTPIEGASFIYGDFKGSSDSKGYIQIEFKEHITLELSHLNYGSWKIPPAELLNALQRGIIYKEEIIYSLKPATVAALHTPISSRSVLSLGTRDRLAHDGGDILNNIEGFNSIRKSGAYGFDPVFRGFKYDQLNIVIDGIQSASAACPNRMDPPTSQVAPNMISHIEVQKGPHSMRYGNAFGASVNYVSSAPKFTVKNNVYGRLTSSYETNGSVTRSEGTIGMSSRKYNLRLFGSFAKGTDYKDGEGVSVPADFMRASLGASLGIKLTGNQNTTISATRNIARDTDFPSLPMDLRSDDTWLLMVKHEFIPVGKQLKSWNSSAFATLVDHKMDNLLKVIDPRTMDASTPAKTRTFGGRTEGNWKSGKSGIFAGADFRIDKAEGTRKRTILSVPNAGKVFYDNVWQEGSIGKSALFAEYQLTLTGISLIFSGRLELNRSDIGDIAPEFENNYENTGSTDINPSLSVGGIWHAGNDFSTGLWLGRAQRSGSMTERFINYLPVGQDAFELLGNPELKPEINNEADLNLSYKTENTVISLDLFASLLQDYISSVKDTTLTPKFPKSPGVRQFLNIDKALKTGFELSWRQKLTGFLDHRFSMAYTYGENKEANEPLPEIAPLDLRYSLHGDFINGKLHPVMIIRYVTKQDRISFDYGETETPAFKLIDVNLTYQITKYISLTAGIQNLLNETYYEHLNRTIDGTTPGEIFAPGRNFFLSVTLDLN
ncbi:MAG: TonB-dependent receptor [Bacteroidota bacterium]